MADDVVTRAKALELPRCPNCHRNENVRPLTLNHDEARERLCSSWRLVATGLE